MKIEKMIEQLTNIQKICPGADVRLHHPTGNVALFCLATKSDDPVRNNAVFIEDKSDISVHDELYAQIEHAKEANIKMSDLVKNLLDIGFTWEDFKSNLDQEDYKKFECYL